MSSRNSIIADFVTRLDAVVSLTTVVRTIHQAPVLTRYTRSQLPLVFVMEPEDETPEYSGSGRALIRFEFDILLLAEQWNADSDGAASMNSLIDDVLNAVHSDIYAGGFAVNTSVLNTTRGTKIRYSSGDVDVYPLQAFKVQVQVTYYRTYTTR